MIFSKESFTQNMGIGTENPDASAILDISDTTKGVLVPRMTSSQRLSIVSPANGLLVFDITQDCILYYSQSIVSWVSLCNLVGPTGPTGPGGGPIGPTGPTGVTGATGAISGSCCGFRTKINSFSTIGVDIPFNNFGFDDGGNYNYSTGRYTCPSSGVYNFNGVINISCNIFAAPISVSIYVNGSIVQGLFNANGGYSAQSGYSVTLTLNAGDLVSLRISSNNGCSISNTVFSGYKVY